VVGGVSGAGEEMVLGELFRCYSIDLSSGNQVFLDQ
jgi:hypothetical protein